DAEIGTVGGRVLRTSHQCELGIEHKFSRQLQPFGVVLEREDLAPATVLATQPAHTPWSIQPFGISMHFHAIHATAHGDDAFLRRGARARSPNPASCSLRPSSSSVATWPRSPSRPSACSTRA